MFRLLLICLFFSVQYMCSIIKCSIFKPLCQIVSYTVKNEKKKKKIKGKNGLKEEQ